MKHHIALELTDEMVDQLRFVIDSLPICTYHRLILAVLPKLPLESDAVSAHGPGATSGLIDPRWGWSWLLFARPHRSG